MAGRTTVTLTAWGGDEPQPGAVIEYRGQVYRVDKISRVRRAGEAGRRLRLICTRLAGELSEVPAILRVTPPRTPRRARPALTPDPGVEPAAMRLDRLRAKVPLLFAMAVKAVRDGRIADEMAQLARLARIGRDDGLQHGRDYGPGIRLAPIRARRGGEMLRAADVVIEEGPDPDRPNRTTRRARRVDPLLALARAGSITGREIDAAERFREQLEAAQASIPCAGQSEIHLPGFQRIITSDRVVNNCTAARQAMAAIKPVHCPVVLWVVLGGTIAGFARYAAVRHTTAAELLKAGLAALADHYYGRAQR